MHNTYVIRIIHIFYAYLFYTLLTYFIPIIRILYAYHLFYTHTYFIRRNTHNTYPECVHCCLSALDFFGLLALKLYFGVACRLFGVAWPFGVGCAWQIQCQKVCNCFLALHVLFGVACTLSRCPFYGSAMVLLRFCYGFVWFGNGVALVLSWCWYDFALGLLWLGYGLAIVLL